MKSLVGSAAAHESALPWAIAVRLGLGDDREPGGAWVLHLGRCHQSEARMVVVFWPAIVKYEGSSLPSLASWPSLQILALARLPSA